MNKKISFGSALILTSFAVLLTFMLTFVNMNNTYNKILADTELNNRIGNKLSEIDREVRRLFIGEIDNQLLLDAIADGYVRGLGDRYAEYMPADRYMEHIRLNQGRMVGIGVEVIFVEERGGLMEVTNVTPGSPAEVGGMLIGDRICKVEDELISNLGYVETIDRIRGEADTDVTLTVLRQGEVYEEELTLTFTRREVQIQTIRYEFMRDNIGYIKVREFNQETPNEFKAALDALEELGATGFVFDVRNNGGGDLDGITDTLDYLLPEGPIIRIFYRGAREEVRYSGIENELIAPMVVLMNENTASAAELFCAALKDYEKATLIGVTTFGKGTVQSINRLSDNSALKISSARYAPPFSENYDGVGVEPHIEIRLDAESMGKPIERLSFEEDLQLLEALRILTYN
ncbi:MAG: S41 family peptidase [Oscillospiraceae bacterium]|nr:S41 family peptidase [Oscillospiraceae bacterium]